MTDSHIDLLQHQEDIIWNEKMLSWLRNPSSTMSYQLQKLLNNPLSVAMMTDEQKRLFTQKIMELKC